MKCPNCTFDIQDNSESCPYCSVAIDKTAAKAAAVDRPAHIGSSGPTPLPTPLGDLPATGDFAGGDAVEYQPKEIEEPLPAEPSRSAGGSSGPNPAVKNALTLAAFAAVAFAMFKVGVFDNILIPMGLKAPPKPPAEAFVAQAPAEEAVPASEPEVVEEEAVEPEPSAEVKAPAPAPKIIKPEEWWFHGRIYELTTLLPVRGITILFLGGEEEISVRTNSNGEYKIRLPIPKEAPGYEVLIDSTRHADEYLLDSNGRIRRMGARARNQLRTETGKIAPWRGRQAEWFRRDLVLIPL